MMNALAGSRPQVVEEGLCRPDPDAQRALQVLIMAQRTADEHTASAQHQADSIRADARAIGKHESRSDSVQSAVPQES